MNDCIDLSSDSENSDNTIIVERNDINNILKKYSGSFEVPSTSKDIKPAKNIYNLDDFSDEEFTYEPLINRINAPCTSGSNKNDNNLWRDKFSVADFCEDSNDLDTVLNRVKQLEDEQFKNKPGPVISKELESLMTSEIVENPKVQEKSSSKTQILKNKFTWSSSSDDGSEGVRWDLDKIKSDFKFKPKLSEADSLKSGESSVESGSENFLAGLSNSPQEPKKKRARRQNPATNKEAKKAERDLARAAKAADREQKKIEKENQKQLKQALKVVDNWVKPDRCIEYLTVNIDESISDKVYGEVIKAGLKNGGYNYKTSKEFMPNLITWTRKVPTIENMLLQNVFQKERYFMLILEMPEFIHHIIDDTLVGYIQSIQHGPDVQHLSISILGLQKYYKYLKDERNHQFKAAVAETETTKKNVPLEFKDLPRVYKREIDQKLLELQIFCKNIYIRPVEKYEDLAIFVGECTKAVAQIPYKKSKAESLQNENEYFAVNNRDCVRVDKDGNGLGRLWNQLLRMFPLASLETAEAVTAVYPTVNALMEAYENCSSSEEAEKLLQDIPVRRAAGPLGGQRRIGPEFSKRAYKFFCSEENILL